jgi:hypothetical protein
VILASYHAGGHDERENTLNQLLSECNTSADAALCGSGDVEMQVAMMSVRTR